MTSALVLASLMLIALGNIANTLYGLRSASINPKSTPNGGGILSFGGDSCCLLEPDAGTYTMAGDAPPAFGWVRATGGTVTITNVCTILSGQIALVVYRSASSCSAFVFPTSAAAAIATAADLPIVDTGNFTEATTANGAIQSALRESRVIRVPIASFLDADGDPLAKWVDNASPNPGFNLTASKALGLRWNNNATQGQPVLCSIKLPLNSGTSDMTMFIIASKVGATVGDAVTFTVVAYPLNVGALHDAPSDAGGVSTAMTGSAPTKTVQQVSMGIAFEDIQDNESLTFTITPTSGTLGTDDVIIHEIYFVPVSIA
jgi:hypothetical protein